MPVRRFRSVEEMGEAWYAPGDALERAIARVRRQGRLTLQLRFPPGVYRHRTVADLNRQREQWDEANFAAFQRRRAEAAADDPADR